MRVWSEQRTGLILILWWLAFRPNMTLRLTGRKISRMNQAFNLGSFAGIFSLILFQHYLTRKMNSELRFHFRFHDVLRPDMRSRLTERLISRINQSISVHSTAFFLQSFCSIVRRETWTANWTFICILMTCVSFSYIPFAAKLGVEYQVPSIYRCRFIPLQFSPILFQYHSPCDMNSE